jgi:hypothetical protein
MKKEKKKAGMEGFLFLNPDREKCVVIPDCDMNKD